MNKNFKENDIVVYLPKDSEGNIYKAVLGKFKRYSEYNDNVAYVWYHSGNTASATDINDLIKIENDQYIKDEFNSLD